MTDANVVLGYMPDRAARIGDLTVSSCRRAASRSGRSRRLGALVARPRGIHELANATMMRALRAVSTEKGRDPRGVRARRVRRLRPGARGGARGRARRRAPRSCRRSPGSSRRSACSSRAPSSTTCASAGSTRARRTSRCSGSSTPRCGARRRRRRVAAARRRRPLPGPELEHHGRLAGRDRRSGRSSTLVERFEAEHERLYGTRLEPGSPVEIRALRRVTLGPRATARPRSAPTARAARRGRGSRTSAPRPGRGTGRARRARSARAAPTARCSIDEYDTTVVVPPGWVVCLDARLGALVLDHVRRRPQARRRHDGDDRGASRRERARDRSPTRWRRPIFRTAHSAVVRDAMDYSAALCGPTGRDGRAGGDDPAPARLDPERDEDAVRALRRQLRARRRLHRQRPVRRREPHARHLRRQAVLRRRPTARLRRHHRAPRRRRRPRARDDRVRQHRGLPGGPAHPVGQALRPRRAGRGVFEIIRANVRIPHELLGDLNAQVAACTIGDRGLQELAARYGADRPRR